MIDLISFGYNAAKNMDTCLQGKEEDEATHECLVRKEESASNVDDDGTCMTCGKENLL